MNEDTFFKGLNSSFDGTPFKVTKKTPTGRNIFVIPAHGVEITTNYVANDKENRLSVKMTINRGREGAPTPKFDSVAAKHKGEAQRLLDGHVTWDPSPKKTESKVQVERNLAQFHSDEQAMYDWVQRQAAVLKTWAEEIE